MIVVAQLLFAFFLAFVVLRILRPLLERWAYLKMGEEYERQAQRRYGARIAVPSDRLGDREP